MIADTLGRARYFQILGRDYADVVRGSMTSAAIVTAGAGWLGLSKPLSIVIGAATIPAWVALSILLGWGVWKWRVLHATLTAEYRNDPYRSESLDLLREIAANTRIKQYTITRNGSQTVVGASVGR